MLDERKVSGVNSTLRRLIHCFYNSWQRWFMNPDSWFCNTHSLIIAQYVLAILRCILIWSLVDRHEHRRYKLCSRSSANIFLSSTCLYRHARDACLPAPDNACIILQTLATSNQWSQSFWDSQYLIFIHSCILMNDLLEILRCEANVIMTIYLLFNWNISLFGDSLSKQSGKQKQCNQGLIKQL